MRTKPRGGKRHVFGELLDGVKAMKAHREGLLTLRSHWCQPENTGALGTGA